MFVPTGRGKGRLISRLLTTVTYFEAHTKIFWTAQCNFFKQNGQHLKYSKTHTFLWDILVEPHIFQNNSIAQDLHLGSVYSTNFRLYCYFLWTVIILVFTSVYAHTKYTLPGFHFSIYTALLSLFSLCSLFYLPHFFIFFWLSAAAVWQRATKKE